LAEHFNRCCDRSRLFRAKNKKGAKKKQEDFQTQINEPGTQLNGIAQINEETPFKHKKTTEKSSKQTTVHFVQKWDQRKQVPEAKGGASPVRYALLVLKKG
jgi:hypothetical protein